MDAETILPPTAMYINHPWQFIVGLAPIFISTSVTHFPWATNNDPTFIFTCTNAINKLSSRDMLTLPKGQCDHCAWSHNRRAEYVYFVKSLLFRSTEFRRRPFQAFAVLMISSSCSYFDCYWVCIVADEWNICYVIDSINLFKCAYMYE